MIGLIICAIVAGIVFLKEFAWLGRSNLAWMIWLLAGAICYISIYLVIGIKKSK